MATIPDSYEVRDLVPLTVRADAASDGFDGYASTHWAVDSYGTAVAPGAAKKSIRERAGEVLVLWQHDPATIIGVPTELKEDKTGLYTETDVITEIQAGSDALTYLRRGVPLGMSIGFNTVRDRSAEDSDPLDFSVAPDWAKKLPRSEIRVITEYKLWEYSLVTFAANKHAKPTNVRADLLADLLPTLLDDLRAGRCTPEQLALVDQIVAARTDAGPGSETDPPTSTPEARHLMTELELMLASLTLPVEAIA